jgi:hypothetical protein
MLRSERSLRRAAWRYWNKSNLSLWAGHNLVRSWP